MILLRNTILICLLLTPVVVYAFSKQPEDTQEIESPIEVEIVEEPKIDNIEILAKAIQKFEGYYEGSRAYRNNNPCNLRYSSMQAGKNSGFSYFKDYETGFEACKHQIRIGATGESKVYHPDMTLFEFFSKYAPVSDNNNPTVYYKFILKETGFALDKRLKELL